MFLFCRYPYQVDNIESFTLDIVKDQFVKRQLMDASAKNLIKLMTATCGYSDVRQLAAQKLELWLQNPKVSHFHISDLLITCGNTFFFLQDSFIFSCRVLLCFLEEALFLNEIFKWVSAKTDLDQSNCMKLCLIGDKALDSIWGLSGHGICYLKQKTRQGFWSRISVLINCS